MNALFEYMTDEPLEMVAQPAWIACLSPEMEEASELADRWFLVAQAAARGAIDPETFADFSSQVSWSLTLETHH